MTYGDASGKLQGLEQGSDKSTCKAAGLVS